MSPKMILLLYLLATPVLLNASAAFLEDKITLTDDDDGDATLTFEEIVVRKG
jgi:hypothetical protein